MPLYRQTSFAGGELAERLWGRTDLDRYHTGARRLRNFFVSHEGAAVSRPGTQYVGEVKDSTKRVRLFHFQYSDQQGFLVEFGEEYIRFYDNGTFIAVVGAAAYNGAATYEGPSFINPVTYVTYGTDTYRVRNGIASFSGLQPDTNPVEWELNEHLEVWSPYLEADLPYLKFSQSGDVLTITHPDYPPCELRRLAYDSWSLQPIDFARPTLAAANTDEYKLRDPLPTATVDVPEREWQWLVTQVLEDANGFPYESAPKVITEMITVGNVVSALPERIAVGPQKEVILQFYASGAVATGTRKHRVYRGRGKLFGWVGDSDTDTFTDVGDTPDYSRQPPQGRDPFGSLSTGEYPTVSAYFEDRLTFAAGTYIWLSSTGDYHNFDQHMLAVGDDAAEYELASRKREEIRGLISLERLILLTSANVWSFGGAGGNPVDPSALVDAKVHLDVGSSWVDPLVIGDTGLFVRTKGNGVRDVFYDLQKRSYTGGDVSRPAQHLFDGYAVTEWAYAEDPWGVVWAVRDDGKLLSLTYDREAGVWAWALHETDGEFESIAAIPEPIFPLGYRVEDVVYVVVKRTLNGQERRCIERFASRIPERDTEGAIDSSKMWALDCALEAATALTLTPSVTASGLEHLEGRDDVYALVDGAVMGPFTVAGGAFDMELEEEPTTIIVGLRHTPMLEALDLPEARTKQKNVSRVFVEVEASRGLYVGEDEDNLTEWEQREVSDSYGVPSAATGVAEVAIQSSWNVGGRVVVKQQDPLFLTILGLTREVDVGG